MVQEKIDRINALAKKAKTLGLTEAEKAEQQTLRKEFISEFRQNLRGHLENIDIKYEDGHVENVKDRHDKKFGSSEYSEKQ